ncbi:MAG: hypothetical protein HOP10_03725 [Chitinophagaceae bacterium]|nr:hypothetical protein [Chitinophagaceae bacterium]
MKKRIITAAMVTSMMVYLLSSCYRNKEDILALPKVSFRGDVVPIVTAGGCGCHNNGIGTRAVQFSHYDTVFYDAILARAFVMDTMARFDRHPGGGVISFTDFQKKIITKWVQEGAKDDGGGCTVTGTIKYSTNIFPIYSTTCKGSTCHGGLAVTLDYNKMVAKKSVLQAMMNSGGNNGHPGGTISLSSCTSNTFLEWIAQGQPQ